MALLPQRRFAVGRMRRRLKLLRKESRAVRIQAHARGMLLGTEAALAALAAFKHAVVTIQTARRQRSRPLRRLLPPPGNCRRRSHVAPDFSPMRYSAVLLQATWRRFEQVDAFSRARGAATRLQSAHRCMAARTQLNLSRCSAVVIQAKARERSARRAYSAAIAGAMAIQATVRRRHALERVRIFSASRRLQAAWRAGGCELASRSVGKPQRRLARRRAV